MLAVNTFTALGSALSFFSEQVSINHHKPIMFMNFQNRSQKKVLGFSVFTGFRTSRKPLWEKEGCPPKGQTLVDESFVLPSLAVHLLKSVVTSYSGVQGLTAFWLPGSTALRLAFHLSGLFPANIWPGEQLRWSPVYSSNSSVSLGRETIAVAQIPLNFWRNGILKDSLKKCGSRGSFTLFAL